MGQLCYVYSDGFTSTLKNMGFIARIIAITRSRRLRELNNLLANKTGYRITVKNLTDKKGRRKPCLLHPEVMLQRDTTKKSIISEEHNKEDIIKACEEYNGEINLQEYQHSFLRDNAFLIAREKFSSTNQDYSNVINIKQEDKNVKQEEENSDPSLDLDKLFCGFNVGEKRENNESPSNCSPKKKQATTVAKKTSQHLEKSEDNQDEFDEMSFEESQSVELHKKS